MFREIKVGSSFVKQTYLHAVTFDLFAPAEVCSTLHSTTVVKFVDQVSETELRLSLNYPQPKQVLVRFHVLKEDGIKHAC